jgi:hypothetical protein
MSYTTLYAVFKSRSHEISEYRNSWLSAPLLWDRLAADFLGRPKGMRLDDDGDGYTELWKLARDHRVPEHFRIAHAMTFDTCMIAHENVEAAARACCMVGDSLINDENHWGSIGRDLWELKRPDRRMIGYALNATSVNDIWNSGLKGRDNEEFTCAVAYARALLR